MTKNIFWVIVSLLFAACDNYGQLSFIKELPKSLRENSGIVSYTNSTVWFIEDSGNSDNIYQLNFKGKIIRHLDVKNAKNHDWEDLTKDAIGNLYIGDFGNNENRRQNLMVYRLPNPEREKGDDIKAGEIAFNYPEQEHFPPEKDGLLYDAESFFHHKNHLYIITRNRATPFTGEALMYKIPDQKGTYVAEFIGKVTTCNDWKTCQVTSADISPDGKTVVLLGNGKLWTLTDFPEGDFPKGKLREIDLGIRTQLESVCFKDKNTLLISDEVRDKEGGNLYSYSLQ